MNVSFSSRATAATSIGSTLSSVASRWTTRTRSGAAASFGRGLVRAMPVVLAVLSTVGIAAMLWVGGHILLVGLDDLGWHAPYDAVHHVEEAAHDALSAIGGLAPLGRMALTNYLMQSLLGTWIFID